MHDTLVVIPAYGLQAMTHQCIGFLVEEPVDLLVIDNKGDYVPTSRESVLRPGHNTGWLGACNLGLTQAFEQGAYRHAVLLNNDVLLSQGFTEGLSQVAREVEGAGLVGPMANVMVPSGQKLFLDSPRDFTPEPTHFETLFLHGCCLLVTRALHQRIGGLDPAYQPFGWGADVDYAYCARTAGFKVVVSKRSYLTHLYERTVLDMGVSSTDYRTQAKHHARDVFRKKYGMEWPTTLGWKFGLAEP
jgi:GT2 family glycosyltransferase